MHVLRRIAAVMSATAIVLSIATGVIAAEAVPTVEVSGTVLGPEGTVVPVKVAQLTEYEFEGAEGVSTDISVAADGTFTVALRAWGTAEAPARARIFAEGQFGDEEIDEDGCVIVRWPVGTATIDVPGVVPVDPIVVVMDQENLIGACTATPTPAAPAAPGITLPPTAASASPTTPGAGMAWLGLVLLAFSTAAVALRRPRRTDG